MPVRAIVYDATTGRNLERFLVEAQEMCRLDNRYSIIDSVLLERSGVPNNSQQPRNHVGQYKVEPNDRASPGNHSDGASATPGNN